MSDPTAGPSPAGPLGQPSSPGPTEIVVSEQGAGPASAPSTSPAEAASSASSTSPAEAAAKQTAEPDGAPHGAPSDGTDAGATASAATTGARRRRRRPNRSSAAIDRDGRPGAEGSDDGPTPASTEPHGAAHDRAEAGAGESTRADPMPGTTRPRIGDSRPSRPPVAKPRIGDTRPAAPQPVAQPSAVGVSAAPAAPAAPSGSEAAAVPEASVAAATGSGGETEPKARSGRSRRRSGRERRGRPVGRYLMCVHVRPHATQIAVLEGRTLVEHYVSRAADDATQIDGNIYRGRVQNVLPGMEAAFVDIGTPKNAVLYRGDVRYDRDDIETPGRGSPRIEEMLRPGQTILTQVTKNPIGAKGARLTQEVSLPGRFVVMVPNSTAFGISKRLDDNERKRLRRIVDEVRPKGHGLIVRTAAEGASQDELRHDVERLVAQWALIDAAASRSTQAELLYREPDIAVRIVREEFNRDYRGVVIDDETLFAEVRDYVAQVNPELVDRVEYYDPVVEDLPIFERFHVHEQLHKALDRKVWLPSGGSLIIERTEALTVIDVNTGKNVGKSNLEETVYRNNLEAAEEIARQLRLRDIGGIIVIDSIDMEIRDNRGKVAAALRSALARDKTRTQVFDISELGLVEMTRKRVSEGLVESLSTTCAVCAGRGIVLDESLL
ncbi:MAG TPA: Rne/Rng family ribonuclease [Acidimicrobiales bacterium]|nr:Rne/Rng family ribonuclease [Acidimicrobiales bacterium]